MTFGKQVWEKTQSRVAQCPFWLAQILSVSFSVVVILTVGKVLSALVPKLAWLAGFSTFKLATLFVAIIWFHEMMHAWALVKKGIPVSGPFLLIPLGGILTFKKQPKPWVHILTALWGPLCTTMFGTTFFVCGLVLDNRHLMALSYVWSALALLNLLPAAPLDGGVVVGDILAAFHPAMRKVVKYLSAIIVLGVTAFKPKLLLPQAALIFIMWGMDATITKCALKRFDRNQNLANYKTKPKVALAGLFLYIATFLVTGMQNIISFVYARTM